MTNQWPVYPIRFGDFQLNDRPFVVDEIKDYSASPRQFTRMPRITRAGSIGVDRRDLERIIEVKGRIIASTSERRVRATRADVQVYLDQLKLAFRKGPQPFDGGFGDGRYWSSVELDGELEVIWDSARAYEVLYTARLVSPDPYAWALTQEESVDNTALTLLSPAFYRKTITVEPKGTGQAFPTFTIVVPAATAYGITSIAVGNNSVAPLVPRLIMVRNLIANDVLEIDTYNEQVTVNDFAYPVFGTYPKIEPRFGETNQLIVEVSASSTPTLNVTTRWTPRYD